ncbi:unnamed protein product [Psylliodes chrysocephalus]|uniref:Uncharacterized protein n=1 Tax=Psylliodes chrysocephalus TaxID=3402493 RepID=A0A9P0CTF3_9CUCU|nr:unnamed protein product [Psylliodes chrysocephala]
MVRKKGATWQFFKEKGKSGVVGKYCDLEYKHSNVNKMTKHKKKCFKCPEEMKKILYSVPATVSTKLSMCMSTPKKRTKYPQQGQQLKELEVDVSFELKEAHPARPSSSRSQTFLVLSLSETESNATATNASTSNIPAKSACSIFNFNRPQPSPSIVNNNRGGLLTFESLNQSLAKAIFVSGTPLPMVGHPLWLEFFKQLRPSFKPPSRLAVSEEEEISSEMKRQILDDGLFWVRVEKMVNILNPIVELITALESNTSLIHNVYTILQETLKQEMPESPLQQIEKRKSAFKVRKTYSIWSGTNSPGC